MNESTHTHWQYYLNNSVNNNPPVNHFSIMYCYSNHCVLATNLNQ